MLIIYFIVCVLQPICLPIPELITVVWGMQTVGAMPSFIVGLIGMVLGISIMYNMSNKASQWFIEKFHYKNGLELFQHYVSQYEVLFIGLLFIVPILPDEIIALGAPVVGISFPKFILIAMVSKVVSIGMISFSEQIGSFCSLQGWQIIMLELGILLLISKGIRYVDYKKLRKEA
ncbi:MAG: VTT domain-containing protein [bacterium]|nr:VTT domain-containing protein [bacterium]